MRPLDWERVLAEHRVPFVTSGPNVKRGELGIRCPFCGTADPSHHMGLNLTTGWWSCWRNRAQHSGKSPIRLLMRLLGVGYGQAREIAGLGNDYVDPEGFDAAAARFMRRTGSDARPGTVPRRTLQLDRRFVPVTDRPLTRRFWNYLCTRGFSGSSRGVADADALCRLYALHAGMHGEWHHRLVIPYYLEGDLVTWTARAITPATHRYWDLRVDESIVPPKETLFNHDAMRRGGKALIVVEGPMDVLKLDFYGRDHGVRAVGLSTNSVSDEQAFLLAEGARRFGSVLVMMDNASPLGLGDSMRMRQALAFLPGVRVVGVPAGRKDAGELTPEEARAFARGLPDMTEH